MGKIRFLSQGGGRSGSVVECLTRDRMAAGSSLTGITALWFLSSSLVLVQPRMIRPYITERLLMGRKESNQTVYPRVKSQIPLSVVQEKLCSSSLLVLS